LGARLDTPSPTLPLKGGGERFHSVRGSCTPRRIPSAGCGRTIWSGRRGRY
jgi:hypothetical protein